MSNIATISKIFIEEKCCKEVETTILWFLYGDLEIWSCEEVAYELEKLEERKVHNLFHVSFLNKVVQQ